jgi:hypothetical protein
MSAPCRLETEGLEFLLVLRVAGTSVLQRRHLLAGQVEVGLGLGVLLLVLDDAERPIAFGASKCPLQAGP